MLQNKTIKNYLSHHPAAFTLVATLSAFCLYSCMYAYRKPFAAASYEHYPVLFGLGFKSVLVIAQLAGYVLSKFFGIKIISELKKQSRGIAIIILIVLSELALLLFPVLPDNYKWFSLFLNGLPLGMIWGIVFSFLEGRAQTEVMGLGLSASFIFASGFVKDMGKWVLSLGFSDSWMPFVTGLLFLLPMLFFTWLLEQLPEPSAHDIALRTKREPMDAAQRKAFFLRFWIGITLLVSSYILLTVYRDFRDNFMLEIWQSATGSADKISFSSIETPVSVVVLISLMSLVFIKNNRIAFLINLSVIGLGFLVTGIITFLYTQGYVSPYAWLAVTGFGTYIAYIPFNSILFDRMIASFRIVSNVGFLIYISDSFGYLGSFLVLIIKNTSALSLNWKDFFVSISFVTSLFGIVCMLVSVTYFKWKLNHKEHGH